MLQLVIVFYGSRNYAGKLLPASTVVGKANCSLGMGFLQPVQIRRNLEREWGGKNMGGGSNGILEWLERWPYFFFIKEIEGTTMNNLVKTWRVDKRVDLLNRKHPAIT